MKALLLLQRLRSAAQFARCLALLLVASAVSFNLPAQTISTDKTDYMPGEFVVITGEGWLAGETVELLVRHTTFTWHSDELFSTVVLEGGFVYDATYVIDPWDLGETFMLTATGLISGAVATVEFTDAAPFNVSFYASGLPNGTAVQVTYQGTNNGGNPVNGTLNFTTPNGSGPIGLLPGSLLTFTYSSPVAGGYTIVSTQPVQSPWNVPNVSGGSLSIAGIYQPGCVPPGFIVPPVPKYDVCLGSTAIFSTTVSGSQPISYHWYKGLPMTGTTVGANSASFTISPVTLADAGNYYLVITNGCGMNVFVTSLAIDDNPPQITCPADIRQPTDPGNCSAVVTYASPTFGDNCPGASIIQIAGLPSGSVFPLGSTLNTFRATDAAGRTAECSFTVDIYDDQPPVITAPNQDSEIQCYYDIVHEPVDAIPTATDNCGGTITGVLYSIVDDPVVIPNGFTCEGSRTYTYSYSDNANPPNVSYWTFTYHVVVQDFTIPETPSNSQVECKTAVDIHAVTPPVARSSDCSLASAIVPTGPKQNKYGTDTYNGCEGTISFTWTYTDCSGRYSHDWTYTFTVDRMTPPGTFGPVNDGVTVACRSQADTPPILPVVKDICGNELAPYKSEIEDLYDGHRGLVIYKHYYKDCSGLVYEYMFTYTIDDPLPPSILTCPQARVVTGCDVTAVYSPAYSADETESTYAIFSNNLNGGDATDNCGIVLVTYRDILLSEPCPPRVSRIWKLYDSFGNSAQCNQVISILPPAIDLTAPKPKVVTEYCLAQEEIQNLYDGWLLQKFANGGCNMWVSNDAPAIAPSKCGGEYTVTWTAIGDCSEPVTRTSMFTVSVPPRPYLIAPDPVTRHSCERQDIIQQQYDAWLSQVQYGMGCNLHVGNNAPTFAPDRCGGSVTVTWTATSDCYETLTASSTFSVTPALAVELYEPHHATVSACITEEDLNMEFEDWLTKVYFTGGCDAHLTILGDTPPPLCGGTSLVSFTVYSTCQAEVHKTASFTVNTPNPVWLDVPNSYTMSSCRSQEYVDDGFDEWVHDINYGGGCNSQLTILGATPPDRCGGRADVTWRITSDCQEKVEKHATFYVSYPNPVVLRVPDAVTIAACKTQDEVNEAYNHWMGSVQYGGGCEPQIRDNGTHAPSACGGSVTVTWTVTSTCRQQVTGSSTFTVTYDQPPQFTNCPTAALVKYTDEGMCTYLAKGGEFDLSVSDDCNDNTVVYGLTGATTAAGLTTLDGIAFEFGITYIAAIVTDRCGLTAGCNYIVEVNKVTTTLVVEVEPGTQQYSDKVTFKAQVTECSLAGPVGGTVTFYVGSQKMGTANVQPDGTAVLADVPLLEPSPFGTAPTGQMAPVVHDVKAVYSGFGNYLGSKGYTTLDITCEDAGVAYNGGYYFTVNPNNYQGSILASAYVTDPDDGSRGDIRNATVTFHDGSYTGPVIGTSNIPVGMVSANTWEGVASTSLTYTLNNSEVSGGGHIWEIWTTVNNYYCGREETGTTITLAMPGGDYVTGGGHLIMTNTSGKHPGLNNAGKRMNFGLVMKWNKSGKNLQGNINIIYRGPDGYNYQIKSNAINSLAIASKTIDGYSYKIATITTKANLKKFTGEGTYTDLGGNHNLVVVAWDCLSDNTGKHDRISVQLLPSSGSGLLFSSNWSGGTTVAQTLNGGQIQVQTNRAGDAIDPISAEPPTVTPHITVYPNPSAGPVNFSFVINENAKVTLEVYSVTGILVDRIFQGDVEKGIDNTAVLSKPLPEGVYTFRLIYGAHVKTGKFIKTVTER